RKLPWSFDHVKRFRFHVSSFHLPLILDNQDIVLAAVASQGLSGHHEHCPWSTKGQAHPRKHSGQQQAIGIGKLGPRSNRSEPLVDPISKTNQRPLSWKSTFIRNTHGERAARS